jgi:hypothetical protein
MHWTSRRWKRPQRIGVLVATVMLIGGTLTAGSVVAFAPGPGTGNNDPFNPTDFTATCPPGTINLNNPTTHADPVAVQCTDVPSGPKQVTVDWISDTISGSSTDDAWGQGDKSDCFLAKTGGVNGACVTQVFGIGASKTDLQYHGIGIEKGANGHDYLYSGIKRLQAGGITSSNANYNVEINQLLPAYKPANPICPLVSPNTGACNMWRSPGDLTIMTDWGGNQSSCGVPTPAICAYVWIDFSTGTNNGATKTPSPAGSTCFSAQQAPCWGLLPNGSAKLSDNPDKAAGSINSGAATQPSTFSEIGVDLTASGLVQPGACEVFHNVWAHSRSSSSFTAELKDFIFGNVNLSTCTTTTTSLHETDASGNDLNPSHNGAKITVKAPTYVRDEADVSGNNPTGTVAFKYYPTSTDCTNDTNGTAAGSGINLVNGSALSSTVTVSSAGTLYWKAFFTGTNGTSDSASACGDEVLTVRQDSTTATSLHQTDANGADVNPPNNGNAGNNGAITVLFGSYVQDTATVSPSTAGGSVAFKYYGSQADCTNDTNGTAAGGGALVSGSVKSDIVQQTTTGTSFWKAFFTPTTGSLFNASASGCGDEQVTVQKVDTAIATGPWYYPNDKATITSPNGGGNVSGSVKFRLFDTAAHCGAVTPSDTVGTGGLLYRQIVTLNGGATSETVNTSNTGTKISTSTTVYWLVEFSSGNQAQNGSSSSCVESINATLTNDGTP